MTISTIDLEPDQGAVIKGKAIYKDHQGNLIKLSARCLHLGCRVKWNNKEKTWGRSNPRPSIEELK